MKIYTLTCSIIFFLTVINASGQDSLKNSIISDTVHSKMNMDAVYDRPFMTFDKIPIAIGGYLEANTQYEQTDGVSDGLSFQARRLTLFFSSTIARNLKFLSEIEFEDGTKEINIEFAALDVHFHHLLNLRGGIVMNPIGSFNQNHDGPKWDFIDRPISSTTIIPSTFSNVGFGVHGKDFRGQWILGYEAYLTNGLDDKIIANQENRTSLSAGKFNPDKFEESFSGSPFFTGKIAFKHRKIAEIGFSYMGGVYNKWKDDGLIVDTKRVVKLIAVDLNTSLFNDRIYINSELVKALIDVPQNYTQQYGSEQLGGFLDITGQIFKRKVLSWENARLLTGVRLEYADYNNEKFKETGESIGDEVTAITPALAFRPTGSTVFRFNYRYERHIDLLNNPPSYTGKIQFGFSTYF